MRKVLPFVALFIAFLVWTFPHGLLVERILKSRLSELDIAVSTGDVTLTWPPGYRIENVSLHRDAYGVDIDSLHMDVFLGGGVSFDADACGGTLRGKLEAEPRDAKARAREGDGKRLEFIFDEVRPGNCLRLGAITVDGTFGGELRLVGLGKGTGAMGPLAASGALLLEARDGMISGHLPPAADGSEGAPIGEWRFERINAEGRIDHGDLIVERGHVRAEGVEWQVTRARLGPRTAGSARISGDFRARRIDESPRSKAVMGLLPKAAEDKEGWRRYRVAGTLAAPKLIGLK
ncbi:MAG: type II secretion system protein GspN [Candidatus Binatia bacterium]